MAQPAGTGSQCPLCNVTTQTHLLDTGWPEVPATWDPDPSISPLPPHLTACIHLRHSFPRKLFSPMTSRALLLISHTTHTQCTPSTCREQEGSQTNQQSLGCMWLYSGRIIVGIIHLTAPQVDCTMLVLQSGKPGASDAAAASQGPWADRDRELSQLMQLSAHPHHSPVLRQIRILI